MFPQDHQEDFEHTHSSLTSIDFFLFEQLCFHIFHILHRQHLHLKEQFYMYYTNLLEQLLYKPYYAHKILKIAIESIYNIPDQL